MQGKVCIVTGSSSGLGKAIATALAREGATVVAVCHEAESGAAAVTEIKAASGSDAVELAQCDLSRPEQIRAFAGTFLDTHPRLDLLVHSAGIFHSTRVETAEGYDLVLAVNHLAPFLLTNLLLDRLKASAPSRVVMVTSVGHHYAPTIDFDDLQGKKHYSDLHAYHQSKLANVLFMYELARRLEGTGVTANCAQAHSADTKLWRDAKGFPHFMANLTHRFVDSPEKAVETPVYVATSSDVAETTGAYFLDKKSIKSAKPTYDNALCERLWNVSLELTGMPITTV